MVKKITFCGVLSALALISFIIENLLPPLIVPGGKLGISNVFIIFAGIVLGYGYGLSALIIKAVLGSIFAGNFSAILYSLPSGFIAFSLQMALFNFSAHLSIVAISVAGGVVNSVLQGLTFCLITSTAEYVIYTPYLALLGILGGASVGFILFLLLKIMPESLLSFGKTFAVGSETENAYNNK